MAAILRAMRRPAALLILLLSAVASLATSPAQPDIVGGSADGPEFTLHDDPPVRTFVVRADANKAALKHGDFFGNLVLDIELSRAADDDGGPGSVELTYSSDPREWDWNGGVKGPLGVASGETRQLPHTSFEAFEHCKKGSACTDELTVTFTHKGGGAIVARWSASASITLDDEGDSLSDSAEIVLTVSESDN